MKNHQMNNKTNEIKRETIAMVKDIQTVSHTEYSNEIHLAMADAMQIAANI